VRVRHAEVDIRSELAIPLICQDRLVGVLDLESTQPDLFTAEHEQMLVALASHIATAVTRSYLYEDMRRHEQQLQRELDTARQVQRGLLPDEVPHLAGIEIGRSFAPARELAGDFFDFLPYIDGRVAVAVGDVAGKMTPAALYGSLAVGIMRGHVVEHSFSPAQMLAHLNDHLFALNVETRFLAMAYGLLDAENRTLTLAGAGFPWPRLVRDGKLQIVDISGLPLGLFPDVSYDEISLPLREGDVIVLCSDGLEDCLHEQEKVVEDNRLDAWVQKLATRTAQEIADELIRVSDPIAKGQVPAAAADDRTVMVIKVTGT
jgi:sigma-B regulation protein RsbU (phosphoserine phosphatase)